MARAASKFREADIRRIFAAARKASVNVRVEIETSGKLVVTTGGKASEAAEVNSNPWDQVLDAANKERLT